MKSSRRYYFLFLVVVFVVPITAFLVVEQFEKQSALPVLGSRADGKEHRIADFTLIDEQGKMTGTKEWNGKIVVVDFFFTHCGSICPKMTMNLKKVNAVYRSDNTVLINSISVDPERDSAAQLKKYSERFGADTNNWCFLTGEKKEIYKLARNSFQVVATDGDGGPEDFIHSDKLVLVDKFRRIRGFYDGTSDKETDQLIRDIKKLKYED